MKNKSMDYILGMITGIAISIAALSLMNNNLNAGNDGVLEVKVVNPSWNRVKVEIQWNKNPHDIVFNVINH